MVENRYWLGNCHSFRVDTPRGRLGIVEEVLYDAGRRRPARLVVRRGVLGTRRTLVPVDQVEEIEPRRKRTAVAAA
jgi:hypothetical protein